MLNDPVNFIDPNGLIICEILSPTEMGPNTTLIYDKKEEKWKVYDFDTGKTRDWMQPKKTHSLTEKRTDVKHTPNKNYNTTRNKVIGLIEAIFRLIR